MNEWMWLRKGWMWLISRMISGWMSDWMNKWKIVVHMWIHEWVNEWMNEWMWQISEWLSGWVNEWTNEPQYLLPAPRRSVFTPFTLDTTSAIPLLTGKVTFIVRASSGGRLYGTVDSGRFCVGWLLCCREKEHWVALYIISVTSVFIANCNIRLTTVHLRSQKFVLGKFLAL